MQESKEVLDTLVVPSSPRGFEEVFLGEEQWYSFKLSRRALSELKYLAIYQTRPVSAITHYAEIEALVPVENGKYKAKFKPNTIRQIDPIKWTADALTAIQGPRYFPISKLKKACTLRDLVG